MSEGEAHPEPEPAELKIAASRLDEDTISASSTHPLLLPSRAKRDDSSMPPGNGDSLAIPVPRWGNGGGSVTETALEPDDISHEQLQLIKARTMYQVSRHAPPPLSRLLPPGCPALLLNACSMLFAQTAPHFCAAQMVEDLPGDTVGTIRKLLFLTNTQAQLLASTHTHLKKMIDAVSESEQDYGEEGVCTYAREFMCAAGVAEA